MSSRLPDEISSKADSIIQRGHRSKCGVIFLTALRLVQTMGLWCSARLDKERLLAGGKTSLRKRHAGHRLCS